MEKNENTLISSKQKKAVKVVEKLLTAMHHDIKELNKIEDIEDNLETIQKKAVRISKICIVLQNSLDLKHGGEVASNLNHLYQHIRFSVARVTDDKDFSYLKSAEKVTAELTDGWSKISTAAA
ncbi:flagellar protein FliS [Alphaproteobacteria bacterium]|jgi:flagellin-specific chaperone FliS|nr:flagellar protein FliS [Alphaproteobacteria bacterium]|tara:strand:+ start:525 stop:893 length:369 start_codon:yes stop_codon:yes gene_type:complete